MFNFLLKYKDKTTKDFLTLFFEARKSRDYNIWLKKATAPFVYHGFNWLFSNHYRDKLKTEGGEYEK